MILIILLVSALVLPVVLPAVSHQQVTESGRILQAALVQARAAAVKAQAPRGIRLLPDPTYAGRPVLAANRWTWIEPGPKYASGQVVIWPTPTPADINAGAPVPYVAPYPDPLSNGNPYPYLPQSLSGTSYPGQVLMVEEAPYNHNNPGNGRNNPTSWFWNVRIGDRIRIGGAGRAYTVVGPMTATNPELFVNDGQPGQPSSLVRTYYDRPQTDPGRTAYPAPVEYLYVVNGQDDDSDGFVDNGWDGVNNNYNFDTNGRSWADELLEWQEVERWLGAEQASMNAAQSYFVTWSDPLTNLGQPRDYVIERRPVPSPGAQETSLPSNIVIDLTTWDSTSERSRLPVDPKSHFVDILLQPNGQVVLTTEYSSPSSFGENAAFLHFWLAERQDILDPAPQQGVPYLLPMPEQTTAYPNGNDQVRRFLKGERMLLTLFTRSGQVTTNPIAFFHGGDINTPFYDSQLGARGAK